MNLTDITTAAQARQLRLELGGRCPAHHDKVKFPTAEAAAKAVLVAQVRGRSEQRFYRCPEGAHYHVTSKPARRPTTDSKVSAYVVELASRLA